MKNDNEYMRKRKKKVKTLQETINLGNSLFLRGLKYRILF